MPAAVLGSVATGGALSPLAAALIGGGTAAAGQAMQKGSNFGDILKAGVQNGGLAGAGAGAADALMSSFAPSSAAAAPESGSMGAFGWGGMSSDPTITASQGAGGNSLLSKTQNALGDLGSWASKNPNTVGQAFSAVGEAPLNDARAREAKAQAAAMEYNLNVQKQRDQALDPLRVALLGKWAQYGMQAPPRIAPNPHLA